jgi:hypothetical protein
MLMRLNILVYISAWYCFHIICGIYAYHYLHKEYISRLGSLNFEWPGKIMDFCEIDIFNVISAVIVS